MPKSMQGFGTAAIPVRAHIDRPRRHPPVAFLRSHRLEYDAEVGFKTALS